MRRRRGGLGWVGLGCVADRERGRRAAGCKQRAWLRPAGCWCTAGEGPWGPSACSTSSPGTGCAPGGGGTERDGVRGGGGWAAAGQRGAVCPRIGANGSLTAQWVASIDLAENEEASASVVVRATESFTEQAEQVGARGDGAVVAGCSGVPFPRGSGSL